MPTLTFSAKSQSITRSAGSWTADGFAAGKFITITGTQSNNGIFTIDSISSDGTVLNIRLLSTRSGSGVQIATQMLGSPGLTFAVDATSATVQRSDGNWLLEGFAVGQIITVADTQHNNGAYRITGVTGTTLTLALMQIETATNVHIGNGSTTLTGQTTVQFIPGSTTLNRLSGSNTSIEAIAGNLNDNRVSANTSLQFQPAVGATPASITRLSGTWISDGFAAGETIHITGTAPSGNDVDGLYDISSVSSDGKTIFVTDGGRFKDLTVSSGYGIAILNETIFRNVGNWRTDGFLPGATALIAATGVTPDKAISVRIKSVSDDGSLLVLTYDPFQINSASLENYRDQASASFGLTIATDTQVEQYASSQFAQLATFFNDTFGSNWQQLPQFLVRDPNFSYKATDAQATAVTQHVRWTPDQLSTYLENTSLATGGGGQSSSANVVGKTITLTAGNQIGIITPPITVTVDQLRNNNLTQTQRDALAAGFLPGDTMAQGVDQHGNVVNYPADQTPAGVTLTGYVITLDHPLLVQAGNSSLTAGLSAVCAKWSRCAAGSRRFAGE